MGGITRHDVRMFVDALARAGLAALVLLAAAARESWDRWRAGAGR